MSSFTAKRRNPAGTGPKALIESLGEQGSIVVYSAYEEAMMRQVAGGVSGTAQQRFPPSSNGCGISIPIIKEHYYHPAFQGSYSIKSVLPAWCPQLSMTAIWQIQEGGQAASEYYRMVFLEEDWIEQARIKDALVAILCKGYDGHGEVTPCAQGEGHAGRHSTGDGHG